MNLRFRALTGRIEGFMAVAVVLFGKWRSWAAFAVVLLFGGAVALQLRLQGMQTLVLYQVSR